MIHATPRFLALALASTIGGIALADGDHATVTVEAVPAAASNLEFHFTVVPAAGLHINMEGPWKLELTGTNGLTFAHTTFAKGDMDKAVPGRFVATTTAKPAAPAGDVEYALTAFVCTDDKTQCYREVKKGKAGWKTAAK
jgi:hypothetical protein